MRYSIFGFCVFLKVQGGFEPNSEYQGESSNVCWSKTNRYATGNRSTVVRIHVEAKVFREDQFDRYFTNLYKLTQMRACFSQSTQNNDFTHYCTALNAQY